jgi:hypothetical protein
MALAMADVLLTFRRRIGDLTVPYTYDDSTLEGYLSDAVARVEDDWTRGFSVDFGLFNQAPTKSDANLFCIKAHYLLQLSIKDQADRNNFRMVKGRLTLDNTNQAKDHLDTLNLLNEEYKSALLRAKNGSTIKGIRLE